MSSTWTEFKAFVARGNVIDLAVGLILGAGFSGIVNSLVNDIVMPAVGMITGGIDFSNWFVPLKGGHYVTLADAKKAGEPVVAYGLFVNAVLNFLVVAAAVFLLVKQVNHVRLVLEGDEALVKASAPPTRTETLLEEIRDSLRAR